MPRRKRTETAGVIFHVCNRSAKRLTLFDGSEDYEAFLACFVRTQKLIPLRLFAYCVMPNHFHMVVQVTEDGQLSAFMHLFSGTHALRWNSSHKRAGQGAVYQGRFKALPVQDDEHFLTVCRYVERNPVRAKLVERPEHWAWSSFSRNDRHEWMLQLDPWPVARPAEWALIVSGEDDEEELERLRKCVRKNTPFGDRDWASRVATALRLERSTNDRGRPSAEAKGAGTLFRPGRKRVPTPLLL
jgi:putative transposase